MSKWTTLLDRYINFEIRPPKSTDETDETPPDTPDKVQKVTKHDSFVSFVSDFSGPCFENAPDAESIVERSAIHEFDANMKRDQANMEASRAYDRQRQLYEAVFPDRDPAGVEWLYAKYITDWQPDYEGDLPATPPNTRGNENLWRAWWEKVEDKNNG